MPPIPLPVPVPPAPTSALSSAECWRLQRAARAATPRVGRRLQREPVEAPHPPQPLLRCGLPSLLPLTHPLSLSVSVSLPPPTTHAHTGAHTLLPLALSRSSLTSSSPTQSSSDISPLPRWRCIDWQCNQHRTRCSTRPSSHPIENRLKLFRRLSEKASVNRQAAAGETPTPTHTHSATLGQISNDDGVHECLGWSERSASF